MLVRINGVWYTQEEADAMFNTEQNKWMLTYEVDRKRTQALITTLTILVGAIGFVFGFVIGLIIMQLI